MTPKEELTITFNHLMLVQGFRRFSMVALAQKAGISRAKLYLYFKNKDEIVAAVVERHLRFMRQAPVPATPEPENLRGTLLNAFLLMGATTERFMTELQASYPQHYREVNHAYKGYFADLKTYYQRAQTAELITATVSADYLIFQNHLNIQGILQRVASGTFTLEQGETYLREGFTFQLQAMLLVAAPTPPAVASFMQTILGEYYDTYALIDRA